MKKIVMKIGTAALIVCGLAVVSPHASIAADKFVSPSQKDKCRVCGMFVSKYPAWVGAIYFTSGLPAFFDGPKDLFTYLLNIQKYSPGVSQTTITAIRVKDYYSLAAIDGRTAWYVVGSDVYGPMGQELVPFSKESDARSFLKDHQGKKIVTFKEVTPTLLKMLE